MNIKRLLQYILFPEKAYLRRKYYEHRKYTIAMSTLCSLGCAGLWIWDYVIDPIGAKTTIWLRLLMLAIGLIYTLVLRKLAYSRWITAAIFFTAICWEVIFVSILNLLDTGMVFGISGFMFFLLFPLLIMQGLSTRVNIFYIIIIALIPQLLAIAGFARSFQHKQYAVLIWSEAVMAIIVQITLKNNYLIRCNTQRQLEIAATTDKATGVSNRGYFMNYLKYILEASQAPDTDLSIILLDIDEFKGINDKYGHPAGDKVIEKLADICKDHAGERGMIGRLGGEEFCILLSGVGQEQAMAIAEGIRQNAAEDCLATEKGIIRFTCSLGVAEWRGDSLEEIYERVDHALYKAKQMGRNQVCLAQ